MVINVGSMTVNDYTKYLPVYGPSCFDNINTVDTLTCFRFETKVFIFNYFFCKMILLYILPSEFTAKDYCKMDKIKEVRPMKLVQYENILEELGKQQIKQIKNMEKRFKSSYNIKEVIKATQWNNNENITVKNTVKADNNYTSSDSNITVKNTGKADNNCTSSDSNTIGKYIVKTQNNGVSTDSNMITNEKTHTPPDDTYQYNLDSFEVLIKNIQFNFEQIQKKLKIYEILTNKNRSTVGSNDPYDFTVEDCEKYQFIKFIYCILEKGKTKEFEKLFPSKTTRIVHTVNQRVIYQVYCIEKEKTEKWLKEKGILIYMPRKRCKAKDNRDKEINNKMDTNSLNDMIEFTSGKFYEDIKGAFLKLAIITHLAKGLSESLNKFSLLSEFKYKIIEISKEAEENEYIKKMNKGFDFEESVTIIYLDI